MMVDTSTAMGVASTELVLATSALFATLTSTRYALTSRSRSSTSLIRNIALNSRFILPTELTRDSPATYALRLGRTNGSIDASLANSMLISVASMLTIHTSFRIVVLHLLLLLIMLVTLIILCLIKATIGSDPGT